MRLPYGFPLWLRVALPLLTAGLTPGAALHAQLRPAEITYAQSGQLPYRLSGRLNVTFGDTAYFGTASYIRRYTGVTAGHMLYDPTSGLGTDLYYQPALYADDPALRVPVRAFAVLSGYQSAAGIDPNSNGAFAYDMGYVIFDLAAPSNEWAAFGADTDALITDGSFLVFGYAAESFPGDELAFVNVPQAFYELQAPGLYENTGYYTEEGMSGGPLYVTAGSAPLLAAVTVAGTSPPDEALSDVRAITPAEVTLFTEAEYAHGLITSGTIKGPATVAPGAVATYRTGVVFSDGAKEGVNLPRTYGELVLTPAGSGHREISVTKLKIDHFQVRFPSTLASGQTVTLHLLRDTTPKAAQTPLQTLTVTVQ